jgi:hypothetical protein
VAHRRRDRAHRAPLEPRSAYKVGQNVRVEASPPGYSRPDLHFLYCDVDFDVRRNTLEHARVGADIEADSGVGGNGISFALPTVISAYPRYPRYLCSFNYLELTTTFQPDQLGARGICEVAFSCISDFDAQASRLRLNLTFSAWALRSLHL